MIWHFYRPLQLKKVKDQIFVILYVVYTLFRSPAEAKATAAIFKFQSHAIYIYSLYCYLFVQKRYKVLLFHKKIHILFAFSYKNDANFAYILHFSYRKLQISFLVRNSCDSLLFYKKSIQIITFSYEQDINLHFLIR